MMVSIPKRDPRTGRVSVDLPEGLDLAAVQVAGARALTFYGSADQWLGSQAPGPVRPVVRGVTSIEVVEVSPGSAGQVRIEIANSMRNAAPFTVRLMDAPWAED